MRSLLSGLYYPFSRCSQPNSLKQMLLVFDQITFVDPVDDADWRATLLSDMEPYNAEFSRYKGIDAALPCLIEQGCVRRFDPGLHIDSRLLATESALADLSDNTWMQAASNPQRYGMPSITASGVCSWQAFRPKLPEIFIGSLRTHPELRRHLLVEGDEWNAWTLSYAAGSAIGISVHLEIAEELNLAPITDSPMHHRLLLMKLARALNAGNAVKPIADDTVRMLATSVASTLLSRVLPEEDLHRASFEDIVRFREHTAQLRGSFVADIETRFSKLRSAQSSEEWVATAREVLSEIESELRKYDAEFASGRMKIWPGVLKATTSAVASGSLAAVALSLIPGPNALLVGSIAGVALGAAVAGLDWAAERIKIERSAAPAIAYLSRVSRHIA